MLTGNSPARDGPTSRTESSNSFLSVSEKHILKIGAKFRLGKGAYINAVDDIFWGENGCLGGDSYVGPRESGYCGKLIVGDNSQFDDRSLIDLCSDVIIGSNVKSEVNCIIYTHNHMPFENKLIWNRPITCAPVTIDEGVWIGVNCVILPGVEIGRNSIIAAGAIVTRSLDYQSIVGGVPARLIRKI